MNCRNMMQIPELTEVLKRKQGKTVWSSLYDGAILQTACSASKVNTGLNNYIHGGEFVVLTNPSVTNDSQKLVLEEKDRNAAEQLSSSILDAEHLSRERDGTGQISEPCTAYYDR